jgi:hypothetical protein
MSELPDRELTPTELRRLIESNARSIQTNSDQIRQGFVAVADDLSRLARLMEGFFQGQAGMNGIVNDTLAGHETRIQQLE